jgi:hypothetical protein
MTITAECQKCDRIYRLDREYRGKKLRCKDCAAVFTVPIKLAKVAPREDIDEDDDTPVRRKRKQNFLEDPKNKPIKIGAMVIVTLLSGYLIYEGFFHNLTEQERQSRQAQRQADYDRRNPEEVAQRKRDNEERIRKSEEEFKVTRRIQAEESARRAAEWEKREEELYGKNEILPIEFTPVDNPSDAIASKFPFADEFIQINSARKANRSLIVGYVNKRVKEMKAKNGQTKARYNAEGKFEFHVLKATGDIVIIPQMNLSNKDISEFSNYTYTSNNIPNLEKGDKLFVVYRLGDKVARVSNLIALK